MLKLVKIILPVLVIAAAVPALASGDVEHPPEQHWSFDGIFGTYDRAAMQRGFKVYSQVCAACHSMERMSYRNLAALGYNEAQLKTIAAEVTVIDGPDDEGEMFERPGLPSDRFVSPYANKKAAAYANGIAPPDMSLLAKARPSGHDYIYAIMTGYEEAPHGHELAAGQHWNKYMPGHVIAMAAPLADGMVGYEDGSPETVDQYAKDVAHFLAWAAEPKLEARKQTGLKVFLFLLVFTAIMYGVKKKVWAKLH